MQEYVQWKRPENKTPELLKTRVSIAALADELFPLPHFDIRQC
jgi:hypothetical protein